MKKLFITLLVFNSVLFSQWESIEINPVNGLLFSFHMSDSLNLTAVFMDDTCYVIKSSDGGKNWFRTQRIPILSLTEASVIDENHIFARLNSPSQMIFTSDGGSTWSEINLPTQFQNLKKIQFLDSTTVYAAGDYGSGGAGVNYLLKSTDKGVNWNIIDSAQYIDGFHFKNVLKGWVFAYGEIHHTTDGGDVKIFENRVYLLGDGIFFAVSRFDINEPWEIRTDQTFLNHSAAAFLDPGYAIIADEGGGLFVSTDRGNHWATRRMQKGKATKISIVNDSLVYLASDKVFSKSEDLCLTIDSISQSPTGNIYDIYTQEDGTIWIASGTTILSSSNGGRNWDTKLSVSGINFDQVIMFEDGTGYACNVSLYKTTDNGNTWNQLSNLGLNLREISFINSSFGIFLTSNSKIYKTTDGGATISEMIIPGMGNSSYIYMKDSLSIYVSANNLYSTYDGGLTWKINEFLPTYSSKFSWMGMYDLFEGIGVTIVNSGGSGIWKTNNRGNTPVELSAFSAIPLGNKVTLQWTTETETNNMGFEIERRFKNGDWKKIGFSKGHGTATQKIYYTFDDLTLSEQGFIYYRLKQIDYNGDFHYSKEVEVIYGEIPENYAIQQNYPNPFNPSTKVTFSLPEENKVVIKVFNAMGELVKEIDRGVLSHGYFEQDFEMGTESSGMYFCQVLCTNTISGRTKSLTIKMVLMK
ncbi:MAG: T9SS type A sorting domain-containing protein [Ignavibacteriales bacterium]|nr:T9SS type A sorting domain-containing protein [Ignavibacteriales bacterium]